MTPAGTGARSCARKCTARTALITAVTVRRAAGDEIDAERDDGDEQDDRP